MKRNGLVFIAAVLAPWAAAAEPSGQHDAKYVESVAPRFSSFAGSEENLESLATGLRHGSEITLTGPGESVTFSPGTRPMGYGNVTHALDLTSRSLAARGITNPTPQQLQAGLQDVLGMRANGMGWGQIRNALGLRPGAQVSTAAGPAKGSGIVTAGGAAAASAPAGARGQGHGIGSAAGRGNGGGHGRGGKR